MGGSIEIRERINREAWREAWREVWRGPAVRSILRHLKAWQGRGFVKAVRGLGC
jgi:hypothetical protein